MPIAKVHTEIYVAAYGGGNVTGGGPYDSSGSLVAAAVQYHIKPLNGDVNFNPARPAVVRVMHQGRFTGEMVAGDDAIKPLSFSFSMKDQELRNFFLGRHATAVSTISNSAASADPSDVPFNFWVKRVTRMEGVDKVEIIGHCYVEPAQAQGELETVTINAEVTPPDFVTVKDGFIYIV